MRKPLIKAFDMAYPRFQVPDLDKMESFLTDFGMIRSERTDTTLYMRGAGPNPIVHVSHIGETAGFKGFAFQAASREDLDLLARSDKFSPVEAMDSPGGGWRTCITDPIGLEIEVVYGMMPMEPLAEISRRPYNMGTDFERDKEFLRVEIGPSRIKRFGHLQLNVPDIPATLEWYQAHFGILVTDLMKLEDGETVAVFSRCDKGHLSSDHHNLLFTRAYGGVTGLNHVSWEVVDMDDVHAGHEHLHNKKRTPEWGVGRHLLGSQIFDYWNDPWGQIHEHWTDGDQIAPDHETGIRGVEHARSQWGPQMPDTYRRTSSRVKTRQEI